jgi:signal transduction histidine kinase
VISDTGAGIQQSDQETLFKLFGKIMQKLDPN